MGAVISASMSSSVKKIAIIDYGMGNIGSVSNAFSFLGVQPSIVSDASEISKFNYLVLPGVGSFRRAMESLMLSGMDDAIVDAVNLKKVKIIGICLGMQLMGISSTEDGNTLGLGLIKTTVNKFEVDQSTPIKVPHIGFNSVAFPSGTSLGRGLNEQTDFYFVHSYFMSPDNLSGNKAICNYGVNFLAAYENENISATQFHPEKSQSNGLVLLKNFLEG